MKRLNKKGFTMAELLIVVAIIAVLVAIAIPIFSAQLEKSRDAVTVSNLRAAYAEASADYLTNGSSASVTKQVVSKGTSDGGDWATLTKDLPFTLDTTLSGKLDKSADTYDVTFTFDPAKTGKEACKAAQ